MLKPLLLISLLLSHSAIAATFIQLESEPDEYLSQGRQEMLTEPLRLNASEQGLSISQEQGYSFVFTAGEKIKKLQPGVCKSQITIATVLTRRASLLFMNMI